MLDVGDTYIGIPPQEGMLLKAPGKVAYLLAMIHGRQTGDVHLENLELTALPPDVVKWPGVQISGGSGVSVMDIGVGLPPEAKDCLKIKGLYMDNNKMEEIPKNIKHLTTILSLSLRNNLLKNLCAELEQLASLTMMDLSDNQIRGFPRGMRFAPTLKVIKLSNNRFSFLPPNLANLTMIEVLHVDGNIMRDLPAQLGEAHDTHTRARTSAVVHCFSEI